MNAYTHITLIQTHFECNIGTRTYIVYVDNLHEITYTLATFIKYSLPLCKRNRNEKAKNGKLIEYFLLRQCKREMTFMLMNLINET